MTDNSNGFSEHKIYEDIFNIFERELKEISHFVAFADCNMEVCSNKIHELHLRVCSEIENILKSIVHQCFIPKEQVDKSWEDKKSKFLKNKNLVDKYEELKKELNKDGCTKVEKLLYGFPDFAFYLKIACETINLDKKVVNFKAMISRQSNYNKIKPFVREPDVPDFDYHNKNILNLKFTFPVASDFFEYDDRTLESMDLESFDYAGQSKVEESIFYTYVDYQNVIDIDEVDFWQLQYFARFVD